MAPKKSQKSPGLDSSAGIVDAFDELRKRFAASTETEFFESGSYIFDAVLSNGKGLPKGCMIEVASPAGTGKTTLFLTVARHLCSQGKRVVYIDSEMGINEEMLESFDLTEYYQTGLFQLFKICVFDEIEDILSVALDKKSDVAVVMIDSITQLIPQSIIDNSLADSKAPAIQARNLDMFFKKYKVLAQRSGVTFLFINQYRMNINAMHTSNQAAGGNSLKHSMDIRIEMKKRFQQGDIKRRISGDGVNFELQVVGSVCEMESSKNRFALPNIKRTIFILFGKGVSNTESFIDWLISHGYASGSGNSKFRVSIPGMEEQTFRNHAGLFDWVNEHFDAVRDFIKEHGWFYLISPGSKITEDDGAEDE